MEPIHTPNVTACTSEQDEQKFRLQQYVDQRMRAARSRLLENMAARDSRMGTIRGDAVLIELRDLRRNTIVLANFRSQLPIDAWTVHFWHGMTNDAPVRSSPELAAAINSKQLVLLKMRSSAGTPIRSSDFSYKNYTGLLRTRQFWNSFTREQLLLFEPDTVLCPSPAVKLHAFAEYAYVGAPWAQNKNLAWAEGRKAHGYPAWCFNLEHCVGNCGLSLWRRDVIAEVLSTHSIEELELLILDYLASPKCLNSKRNCHPKRGRFWGPVPMAHNRLALLGRHNGSVYAPMQPDVWFSRSLQALRDKRMLKLEAVPDEDAAALFAVESSFAGSYTPFAAHKPHPHLSPWRMGQLLERCPPLRSLLVATAEDAKADRRTFLPKDFTLDGVPPVAVSPFSSCKQVG